MPLNKFNRKKHYRLFKKAFLYNCFNFITWSRSE